MKKFIAAFDGLNFRKSTMHYAIHVAKRCHAHLVGVFLEDFTRRSYGFKELSRLEATNSEQFVKQMDERDNRERDKCIDIFEQACRREDLTYSIHRDRNVALQELLEESIYADLLLINAAESMNSIREQPPTRFVRDLLDDVQCPVILVPAVFHPFSNVVMLYDGELSSVHAVKAFSNVFDVAGDLKTVIITVKEDPEAAKLPHKKLINEFIERHHPNAEYIALKGDARNEIIQYLQKDEKKPLLVMGAYRRSKLSRILRPSMADYLLQHLQVPLFIAHNKS